MAVIKVSNTRSVISTFISQRNTDVHRPTTILLLCVVGCATPKIQVAHSHYWKPTQTELAGLEPVILKYIYIHLSDQRPSLQNIPEIEVETDERNGQLIIDLSHVPSFETPAELSIQRIPLQSYRREYLGTYEKEERKLTIAFFDPKQFPKKDNDPSAWMMGGFPHFFTITINMNANEVNEHYASRL